MDLKQRSLFISKKVKKMNSGTMFIILFVLFTLLLGITSVATYSAFQSTATSNGAMTFNTPIYTITLDNANATTNGTSTIYEKYVIGTFTNSQCTTQMTTSTNPITKPTRAYTISYNSNGGSSCSNQTATYIFNGYYTLASGGVQMIGSSGYITNNFTPTYFSSNTTLHAQWGSASITLPTPTYTGYTFGGWYGESALTNKIGDGGASYTPTANKTLYAKWIAKTYTITTGKSTNTNTLTVANSGTFGSGLSISWAAGSATGYTYSFSHVKVYSGNSTSGTLLATYDSGTSAVFMMNSTTGYYSSIYVYATHTRSAISYSITYNYNGGSASNLTSYTIETPTFTLNNPIRSGYDFTGWSGSGSGTTITIAQGSVGNRSYTANWVKNTFQIRLVVQMHQMNNNIYYAKHNHFMYSTSLLTNTSTISSNAIDLLDEVYNLTWQPGETYADEFALSYSIPNGSNVYIYTPCFDEEEVVLSGISSVNTNNGTSISEYGESIGCITSYYGSGNWSSSEFNYNIWQLSNVSSDTIVTFCLRYDDDS